MTQGYHLMPTNRATIMRMVNTFTGQSQTYVGLGLTRRRCINNTKQLQEILYKDLKLKNLITRKARVNRCSKAITVKK